MHHTAEGHAEDKDMLEAPCGRHDIVIGMFSFVCDVKYYAHHRDSFWFS